MQRADEASKALFQGNHRRRNLILEKCITPVGVNRLHSRGHNRIAGHRERQAIDNYAA